MWTRSWTSFRRGWPRISPLFSRQSLRYQFTESTPKEAPPTATSPVSSPHKHEVLEWIHEYDKKTRFRGFSTLKWGLGLLGVTLGGLVVYKTHVYNYISGESAKIAEQTISDERVLRQASQLSKQVTDTLLHDEEVVRATVDLLISVMNRQESHELVTTFLTQLMEDPKLQHKLFELLQQAVLKLSQDAETQQAVTQLLIISMQQPSLQEQVQEVVNGVLMHPDSMLKTTDLLVESLQQKKLVDEATQMSMEVSHRILHDPRMVQDGSDYSWNAFLGMWVPKMFRSNLPNPEVKKVEVVEPEKSPESKDTSFTENSSTTPSDKPSEPPRN